MNLAVASISAKVTPAQLNDAVAAINQQVAQHFQPQWQIGGTVTAAKVALVDGQPIVDRATQAIIYLGDMSQDPGTGIHAVAGYHYANHGNIPYGFVYLDVCQANGLDWTVSLSHEVLETLADPTATKQAPSSGPDPDKPGSTTPYGLEVCDATQMDSYLIGTVNVSNFVTRAYFDASADPTKTTYLGQKTPLAPFGARPGGVIPYLGMTGWTLQSDAIAPGQRTAWALMGQFRRNNRRAAQLKIPAGAESGGTSDIDRVLSKGELGSGHRSRQRAAQLLPSLRNALGIQPANAPSLFDSQLLEFSVEAILGAAWYQTKCWRASWRVWGYIALNAAIILALPVALVGLEKLASHFSTPTTIASQVTGVLTGILALQKTLSAWYAGQQRYATWYKSAADLKTIYYGTVQAWTGKTAQPGFIDALQGQTAAARKVISDEQLDYYQKLALPSFDILDMMTSTKSTVATLVGSLLPGAPPATLSAVGKNAVSTPAPTPPAAAP